MHNFYMDKLTVQQISNIPFFEGLKIEIIEKFVDVLKVYKYRKDEYVFNEGTDGKEMYFILKGTAKIVKRNYRGYEKILGVLTENQFFGEMALIDRGTRSTGVIAETELIVAILSWEVLDEQFASYNPPLALYTYKKIAETLSMRLRKINALYVHDA